DGEQPWLVAAALIAIAAAVLAARRAVGGLVALRATSGTPWLSRRLSRWVGSVDLSTEEFLCADGAGPNWVALRRRAIDRLSRALEQRHARSSAWGSALREGFSDLRFTDANRVPFPFARVVRE